MSYKKIVYSSVCMCGHTADDHHGGIVANLEYYEATGEDRIPLECLYYGSNEYGGLDENGKDHCGGYVDREDPDEQIRKNWKGTRR